MTVYDVVSRYFDGDVVCEGTFVSWEEAATFRKSVLAWRAATEISLPSVGIEPRKVELSKSKHDLACVRRKRYRPLLCTCGMTDDEVERAL